jgi:MFS superfamily sulfate permease-like transporter
MSEAREEYSMQPGRNRYDLQELAGAFGDLGTLIPFLVGYITINKMDPAGILVAFGLFKILVGMYFKSPVPVQPMKAIGTAAITQPGTITPGAIWASGLFTGLFWLSMGLTGAVTWIAKITSRPIVHGLVLGLGLTFMLEGIKMMAPMPLLSLGAGILTFFLLSQERIPAMLVLLGLGVAVALGREPGLLAEIGRMSLRFRLPEFALARIGWNDLLLGVFVLGLPQVALTLGNAIISTVEENNALFPDRPLTVRTVAIDHGIMNLVGTSLGGIPMCHGAGGLAGHVRFGARTGGSLVMHGAFVLFLGLFVADSVATMFRLLPGAILGLILFVGGLELATGVRGGMPEKADRYVLILTAGLSMWNMGLGYAVGLALWYAFQWKWIRA